MFCIATVFIRREFLYCHFIGITFLGRPYTVVREVLYFARDISCFSTRNLPANSTDRRETFPHDRKLVQFYKLVPKIRGLPPPKKMGPKHAKFRLILYNLTF